MQIITQLKTFNGEYLKAERWYPFYTILFINLCLLITYPKKVLFWDAGQYMSLAKMFITDDQFSLLSYYSQLRGYFFPLMLQVPLQIANITGLDEVLAFRIVSALAMTIVLTVVFPKIFEGIFNFRAQPWQVLIFAGLTVFFWYGNYAYSLSDFPALVFFMAGLFICLRVINADQPIWLKAIWICLAGFCLAAAASIRISYLVPFAVILVIFLFRLAFTGLKISNKLLVTALFMAGSIMVFVPQFMSNRIHYKADTPFQIQTIYMVQLAEGLNVQRVDCGTSIPNTPSLVIAESQGAAILNKYNMENSGLTIIRYLELICLQPFDMAAIYARHLFNGFDITYPTTYVPDIYADTIIYRLVNYSLWFLALSLLWKRGVNIRRDKQSIIICLIIILPALLSIPSRIEVRYFLPVYILVYGCASFWLFSKREYWQQLLNWRSVIAYLCFILACLTFSSYIFSTSGILIQN